MNLSFLKMRTEMCSLNLATWSHWQSWHEQVLWNETQIEIGWELVRWGVEIVFGEQLFLEVWLWRKAEKWHGRWTGMMWVKEELWKWGIPEHAGMLMGMLALIYEYIFTTIMKGIFHTHMTGKFITWLSISAWCVCVCVCVCECFFLYLAILCSLWDLSSLIKDQIWAPAVKALCPSHWAAREFPASCVLISVSWSAWVLPL